MMTEQEQKLIDLAEIMIEHLGEFGSESVDEYSEQLGGTITEINNRDMVEIDRNFLIDVLDFVDSMDGGYDFDGDETYIHRGLRIAIETGKYTGFET